MPSQGIITSDNVSVDVSAIACFRVTDAVKSVVAIENVNAAVNQIARLDIDSRGFAWLPEVDFVKHFAADVDPVKARVMHAVQQLLAAAALQDVMGVPAGRSHPCWYLVAGGDQAIPPEAERQFAKRMGANTIEMAPLAPAMKWHRTELSRHLSFGKGF